MDQPQQAGNNHEHESSRRSIRLENVPEGHQVAPWPMVPKVLKYHAEWVADQFNDEISGLWKWFRTTRPKGIRGWLHLGVINFSITIVLFAVGVITFECSTHELRDSLGTTVLFPMYLPHAVALPITTKSQTPIFLGNFVSFYVIRVYAAWRGGYLISVSRGTVLFAAGVVGAAEISTGACVLRRFLCKWTGREEATIEAVSEAVRYIATVFVTSLLFGTINSVVIASSPIVNWRDFYRYFGTWCMSVLAGNLTASPMLMHLLVWRPRPSLFRPWKICEAFGVGSITTALVVIIFISDLQAVIHPLPYLLFPIIILSAFRFNRVGCALVVFFMSFVCSWASIRRKGAVYRMAGSPPVTSPKLILQVELFVSVLGSVGIMLAAAVREKKRLARDLRIMNEELESTVTQRTQELVMANEELKESQRKAEEASQAKSDFLANMSHEIRTPIHGIMGLTALLLDSELSVDQRDSLSSVKECANLLLHIINSILDLAKIEAGRVEVELVPFNVRQLVSSTMRMLATRGLERHLELLWEVDSAIPEWMVGDSGKIQQCLLNLVGNAVKFTHEGSVKIKVSVDVHYSTCEHGSSSQTFELDNQSKGPSSPLDSGTHSVRDQNADSTAITIYDKPIEWHYCRKDEDGFYVWKVQNGEGYSRESVFCAPILFEVRDTGIGISPDRLLDIFRPFTQGDASTSRVYGGTGLGLCIVQRFVELLGGKLRAESEVNKGSAFRFSVPLGFSEAQATDTNCVDFNDSLASPGYSQPLAKMIPPIPGKLSEEIYIPSPNPDEGSDETDASSLIPEKGGEEKAVSSRILDKGGEEKDVPSPILDVGSEEKDVPASIADRGGDEKMTNHVASSNLLTRKCPVIVELADSEDGGWNKALHLHVLLAEDNIINQKVAVRQLQKHGHKVTVVGDGVGALDAVKAKHDLYDLVIMDVQMPNMDGLEATRKIREEEGQHGWRRVPILGLTAHAIQGYELTCLSCGMDGYLGKPFDINQLLRVMSKYLPALER
ncbi:unnamed protein product [Calypogeia fissa]